MNKKYNIKNALISVSNKENIIFFAKELLKRGINLISTSGTANLLKKSGLPILEINEYTNFPEIMNGRVKTLHPKIYGGILGRRGYDDNIMEMHSIIPIDMVIVNLYQFKKIIKCKDHNISDALDNIDIGGSAMIRAAAKNYKDVTIIVKISDYDFILNELDSNNSIKSFIRFNLAIKAFEYTYEYDRIIFEYFSKINKSINTSDNNIINIKKNIEYFPNELNLQFIKKQNLRYGENNHQNAVFYVEKNSKKNFLNNIKQTQGKILSYNNIVDADLALECVQAFEKPTCVIVKHGNPCAVAMKKNLIEAYSDAYKCDPISAFGGVIAFNRELDSLTASLIIKNQFVEIIIVPTATEEALNIISNKPNIRVLLYGIFDKKYLSYLDFKRVNNGLLVQNHNSDIIDEKKLDIVTKRYPTKKEINDALFSWKVVKFVKSNAIVYVKDNITISIGAGQMSRIYAIKIASIKAQDDKKVISESIAASDAFFPFRDNIDYLPEGITCIIQPGGSIKDKEVIEAANERNIAMIFTHIRHFRH